MIRNRMLASRQVPLPRHLTIEITSFCNLHCRMCPKTNHAVNTPENSVMSREVFDRLKPLFPHIESLELNGLWGEAFLHPDLYLYMLGEIKAAGVDVYTISNGTLLKDDLARRLVELGLNRLVISLDAATPETYAKIRPPGAFADVVAGLLSVKKWKEALQRDLPRVELAFVGMKANIAEFPDMVRLAGQVGADKVFLQAMGEYASVEGESIAVHDKALGRRLFEAGAQIGADSGIAVELLPADQFEPDRGHANIPGDTTGLRKDCGDLWNKAVITTTGDVMACCAAPVRLGNLRENSFVEIWRGKAYSELRRRFLGNNPPEMCRNCTGMAWVEQSLERDLRFYLFGLVMPRIRRRLKRSLKKVPFVLRAKRALDLLRNHMSF